MSNKKHRHEPVEQREQHSPELKSIVQDIALMFMVDAGVMLLVGIATLVFGLYFLQGELTAHGVMGIGFEAALMPAVGLFICFGSAFVFRVALGFGHFEPWAYYYVEIFSQRGSEFRRGIGFWLPDKEDLHNEDVRRAFNQPECGPKLDDQGRPKRPRDKD